MIIFTQSHLLNLYRIHFVLLVIIYFYILVLRSVRLSIYLETFPVIENLAFGRRYTPHGF